MADAVIALPGLDVDNVSIGRLPFDWEECPPASEKHGLVRRLVAVLDRRADIPNDVVDELRRELDATTRRLQSSRGPHDDVTQDDVLAEARSAARRCRLLAAAGPSSPLSPLRCTSSR